MGAGFVRTIRKHTLAIWLGLAAGILVLAALGVLAWYHAGVTAQSRELPYEGAKLGDAAPGFRLVDQKGASVSLSEFRGMVVVLAMLDPYCTDICPLYAYQYRLAYQALGKDASRVAFLAFNANDEKTAVEEVMAATRKWGMDEIPTWHFLTGSPKALHAAWKGYAMLGSGLPKPDKPDEKQHSPSVFVIDQAGQRRWFFSSNFEGAPPLSALIVQHVRELLAEERR